MCFGNLLYEYAGHRIPSSVGVIVSIEPFAFTNPESHAHLSFVDVITVAFNVADAMRVLRFADHVHNTINREGSGTFCTVESKVPASTAIICKDLKRTSPVHMKRSVREVLAEHTFLYKKRNRYTSKNVRLKQSSVLRGKGNENWS